MENKKKNHRNFHWRNKELLKRQASLHVNLDLVNGNVLNIRGKRSLNENSSSPDLSIPEYIEYKGSDCEYL